MNPIGTLPHADYAAPDDRPISLLHRHSQPTGRAFPINFTDYSGFTNPNVKNKMYWKDAYNVLEDLDQFSALYITYHNCAHSLYPTNPGSNEDEGNEG